MADGIEPFPHDSPADPSPSSEDAPSDDPAPGSVKILLADDDASIRLLMSYNLERLGYQVITAVDGRDALEKCTPDTLVAILDLMMPEMSGAECLENLRKRFGDGLQAVMVTATSDLERAVALMRAGAFDYIVKPVDLGHLQRVVRNASRAAHHARDLRKARKEINMLATLLRELPEPVLRVSENGEVVYVNEAGQHLTHATGDGGPQALAASAMEGVAEALRKGQPVERELDIGDKVLSLLLVPIQDSRMVNVYGRDITRRRRAERALAALHQREVEVAARIQQTLLVDAPPHLAGLQVGVVAMASQQVDGDFFDFLKHGEDCLDVVVADVMGKGLPAALVAAAAKMETHHALSHLLAAAKCQTGLPEPAVITGLLQQSLIADLEQIDSFFTLCYARFDLRKRVCALVNCGHVRPIIWRRETGRSEMLEGGNMPIGFPDEPPFTQNECSFGDGDVFLFYSDGLTEARSPDGEFFGEERLADLLTELAPGASPDGLVRAIRERISAFAGKGIHHDDFTCIAVIPGLSDERLIPPDSRVIRLVNEPAQLPVLRLFVKRIRDEILESEAGDETIDRIQLAVHEAVVNIMKHAYAGQPGEPIHVGWRREGDTIVFRILDWGSPFDAAMEPALPSDDELAEAGYGRYIIQSCMDAVHYEHIESGNCNLLTLVKNLNREDRASDGSTI